MSRGRGGLTLMKITRQTVLKLGNALVSLIVALVLGEVFLRYYFNVVTYKRTEAVDRIQKYLEVRPDIGFVWKPNVDHKDQIILSWADQDPEHAVLSTDQWGFRNHPKAIAGIAAGKPVDVVGVGDSFIEMAARPLYEFFEKQGLTYHSFAMHRQCTPQYNLIIERYALPLHPRWVLYGVFENDFYELGDYQAWRQSGLDWFTYHSGYWCGPPIGHDSLLRPKGYMALYQALLPASFVQRKVQGIIDSALRDTCSDLMAADRLCRQANARLIVLLIPGKETLFHGLKEVGRCYDHIGRYLNDRGIAVLDLRPVILSHPKPRSLFYQVDGHWNRDGIRRAADEIYQKMQTNGPATRPASSRAVP